MVQKGRTTVYIDMEKANRIRNELGVDISTLTSQALDIADSDQFGDIAMELRTRVNEEVIRQVEDEMAVIGKRVETLQGRLERALAQRDQIKADWEANRQSVLLSRYIYQLNSAIIAAQYDLVVVQVSAKEVVEKIVEINPQFDLAIHVLAFKKTMERYC